MKRDVQTVRHAALQILKTLIFAVRICFRIFNSVLGQQRSLSSTKNDLFKTSMPGPSHSLIHSTFSKVPKIVPKCKDGSLPFFALGSRVAQVFFIRKLKKIYF